MNKRFKELLKKVKELINERPFLGGFFTGGIFTLLMEIILVLILKWSDWF